MPAFQPRTKLQIFRDMAARVVARSQLVGLLPNSVIYHLISAATDEDAEQYFQMVQLRETFDLDKCTGSDLDERAAEIVPQIITRRKAFFASGPYQFSRPGTSGTVNIPAGTQVAGQDSQGLVIFRTSASTSIADGNTTSPNVTVTAIEAGERGNFSAGQINRLVSNLPGVTAGTNPVDFTNGRSRESDESFLNQKKLFVQGISRATPTSMRAFALRVQLADGQRVAFAKLVEPNPPTGYDYLYIDDGTGQLDSLSNRSTVSNDIVISSALGDETDVYTSSKPIDDGTPSTITLTRSGSPTVLTRGTDYYLNAALGQITFIATSPLFPGGTLQASDKIEASYTHFTGLIQQVQKVLDGEPTSRLTYPGVRGGGVTTFVLPATVSEQYFAASASVSADFDVADTISRAKQAVVRYINGLDIGDNVIISEIIKRAKVNGMKDFQITSYKGSSFVTNQIVSPNRVARVVDSNKVVIT